MVTEIAVRWLLTAVFAAAGLAAVRPPGWRPRLSRRRVQGEQPSRGRVRPSRPADRGAVAFCAVMCASLAAMTWWAEPAAVTWPQAVLFGGAALWFGWPAVAGLGRSQGAGLPGSLHAMMGVAMTWMLITMPGMTGMSPARPGQAGMAPVSQVGMAPKSPAGMASMSPAATSGPVLVITIVLAVACAAACLPWLVRAIGPGLRLKDPVSASQAAMSAGMAAMMFVML